jgi:hypothetical protein
VPGFDVQIDPGLVGSPRSRPRDRWAVCADEPQGCEAVSLRLSVTGAVLCFATTALSKNPPPIRAKTRAGPTKPKIQAMTPAVAKDPPTFHAVVTPELAHHTVISIQRNVPPADPSRRGHCDKIGSSSLAGAS